MISYERHILRPIVLLESRSTSILFDLKGRILPPNEPQVKTYSNGRLGLLRWFFSYAELVANRSVVVQRRFPNLKPPNAAIDALDLWHEGIVTVNIHAECMPCGLPHAECKTGAPHAVKSKECSATLMWEQRRYDRSIFVPHPSNEWSWGGLVTGPKFLPENPLPSNLLPLWVGLFAILSTGWATICCGLIFILAFMAFNSACGGALLAALSTRLPFLRDIFNSLDKKLCPVVPTAELPCIIAANPDVAGIGVSEIHSHLSSC